MLEAVLLDKLEQAHAGDLMAALRRKIEADPARPRWLTTEAVDE